MGSLLTHPHAWVPDDRLMLDHQLELLNSLPELSAPKSLSACYPGIAAKGAVGSAGRTYIVLHMGPPNIRGWIPEKWTELASALTKRGYRLVTTGTSGEEAKAAKQLNATVPLQDLTGRLNWEEFVNTIAGAQAVVTIDSIAGHVAACFEVPTVVLTAGRQRFGLWRPNQPRAVVVTHPVGCAPCHRSNGCDAMACVRLIDVADVLSGLEKAITKGGAVISSAPAAETAVL
jgi:ADP-heptose:LPS heptosyltransferase